MTELLKKAKEKLSSGDISKIAKLCGVPYVTAYHTITNGRNTKQKDLIIKTLCDFLEARKDEENRLKELIK